MERWGTDDGSSRLLGAGFYELAEHVIDHVALVDRNHRYRWMNRLPKDADETERCRPRVDELVPADWCEDAEAAIERCFETGEPTLYRIADEHRETRVIPVERDGAEPLAILLSRDCSEQAVSDLRHKLQISEEWLRLAVAVGRCGFWEMDLVTRRGTLTPELARALGLPQFGYTADDILARVHPDDVDTMTDLMRRTFAGELTAFDREYRVRDASGQYHWYLGSARRSGTSMLGSVYDITDLRNAQHREAQLHKQLAQAQRLESIGTLAGGIAHDFNNLLMVIMTGTALAEQAISVGDDPHDELASINRATEQAATLTQQLLAFGRRSALRMEAVDLRAVVRHVVSMASRIVPATVHLAFEPPPAPVIVRGDRSQLVQALVNLCMNARDAMPNGGQLSLDVATDGTCGVITVADTGCGIAQKHLQRIFDPFFTTKPTGEGSGLGLAMVHGIVEQHRGAISVDSDGATGTAFALRFPLAEESAEPPEPIDVTADIGVGAILLAEDDTFVRRQAVHILTAAGYRVTAVEDGQQAVEVFNAHPRAFDLLLLDVVMPKLDGWQAYERIHASAPELPVLFSSGYLADTAPQPVNGVRLVSKPYRPNDLLRAVASALTTAQAA